MEFTIRKAQAKDVLPVYRFTCFLEDTDFNYEAFTAVYKTNSNDPRCLYLVAVEGDNIIGFISCHIQNLLHHCGKVAEIQELFVDHRYRKMGVGRQLVHALEAMVEEEQCVSLEVTAQHKRTATHTFYEQLGYIHTHRKFVKHPGC